MVASVCVGGNVFPRVGCEPVGRKLVITPTVVCKICYDFHPVSLDAVPALFFCVCS